MRAGRERTSRLSPTRPALMPRLRCHPFDRKQGFVNMGRGSAPAGPVPAAPNVRPKDRCSNNQRAANSGCTERERPTIRTSAAIRPQGGRGRIRGADRSAGPGRGDLESTVRTRAKGEPRSRPTRRGTGRSSTCPTRSNPVRTLWDSCRKRIDASAARRRACYPAAGGHLLDRASVVLTIFLRFPAGAGSPRPCRPYAPLRPPPGTWLIHPLGYDPSTAATPPPREQPRLSVPSPTVSIISGSPRQDHSHRPRDPTLIEDAGGQQMSGRRRVRPRRHRRRWSAADHGV